MHLVCDQGTRQNPWQCVFALADKAEPEGDNVNIERRPLGNRSISASIRDAYDTAEDAEPVPAGNYKGIAISGVFGETSKGTPYYRVTWRITEGEHTGRRLSRMYFLTFDAMTYTRRD